MGWLNVLFSQDLPRFHILFRLFVCFLLSDENVLVLVIDRVKQFPVHTEEVYFKYIEIISHPWVNVKYTFWEPANWMHFWIVDMQFGIQLLWFSNLDKSWSPSQTADQMLGRVCALSEPIVKEIVK